LCQVSEDSPCRDRQDVEQDVLLSGDEASPTSTSLLRQFIIPHYSPLKAVWDWITLLLVLYTAVCTPYMAAFLLGEKPSSGGSSSNEDVNVNVTSLVNVTVRPTRAAVWDAGDQQILNIIDKIVDIMFIADILINFRTTYIHNGERVDDPKKIAMYYVRGWFIVDALAAIPFDLLLLQQTGTSDVSLRYINSIHCSCA